ncbi:sodium/hydrogen exchanger [Rhodospirillum rubrum ATCC 11170]|uniref:Sodium/hydrogen exchanger n=2 Tax=Rhodospirillum rubrum TaxID=1085 RepID=Q2RVG5_RHORT|nr:sodium/hydrogen exchanger [Rhodospirillum rubrum ATCC 11170]MBK5953443.1 K+/H+ antiporter [Rhodospirillum rubrum]HAP98911.1 potassium/proton antiporter [Rhodospirillum rubrum]HCF18453.1 potassium/proton antiporter [Rhodospirillum rubrum]
MEMDTMFLAILIGAGLIGISVVTSLISFRVGAPLLLVFLGVGLLAGQDGIGGIVFNDSGTAYFIGSLALAVILFDSGFSTRLQTFRLAAAPSIVLATLGVALTTALVAIPSHSLLGLSWEESALMGAVVGSTDAAAVFFLLRVGGILIRDRVRATLEVESSTNDPMAIFLTITLVELASAGGFSGEALSWGLGLAFVRQMGLGLLCGWIGGHLLVVGINRLRLEPALYPILGLALALFLFAAVSMVDGSGFLAIYVAGMVMGNRKMRGGPALRRFQEALTWLAQMTMFLTLGLFASPSTFIDVALPSVLIGLFLVFVARPVAVWLCLLPFGYDRNETAFVAWVGLRGAVSILLAILPIAAGLEHAQEMFNAAFIVVVTSLLLQGWTIRPMARWLGLVVPPRLGPVDKVELQLPYGGDHELLVYRIAKGSPVAEGERIPRWARPSLVVRDGRSMKVLDSGRPQPGDHVYIFSAPRHGALLDRLFARPTALSPADEAYFGDFSLDASRTMGELATLYGIKVPEGAQDTAVGEWLTQRLGGAPARGDRVVLPPIEIIVREMDNSTDVIRTIGLSLDPGEGRPRRVPMFHNARDIIGSVRDWRAARRRFAAKNS